MRQMLAVFRMLTLDIRLHAVRLNEKGARPLLPIHDWRGLCRIGFVFPFFREWQTETNVELSENKFFFSFLMGAGAATLFAFAIVAQKQK